MPAIIHYGGRMSRWRALLAVVVTILSGFGSAADANMAFRFESVTHLNEMSDFVRQHFPLGTQRDDVRRVFVTEGKATLKIHPQEVGVEKYIYDINLCNYYVWRWNVSADYDADGKLQQAYVNGNAVFAQGKPKKLVPKKSASGKKASIYKAQRPRPEAYKGESSLGFVLFDADSDLKTITDQGAIGAGPSRANPVDMGVKTTYSDVDPWRSIFDSDNADRIVAYRGNCADADEHFQKLGSHRPSR